MLWVQVFSFFSFWKESLWLLPVSPVGLWSKVMKKHFSGTASIWRNAWQHSMSLEKKKKNLWLNGWRTLQEFKCYSKVKSKMQWESTHKDSPCLGMPPRVSNASEVKGREAIHWNMVVTSLCPPGGWDRNNTWTAAAMTGGTEEQSWCHESL